MSLADAYGSFRRWIGTLPDSLIAGTSYHRAQVDRARNEGKVSAYEEAERQFHQQLKVRMELAREAIGDRDRQLSKMQGLFVNASIARNDLKKKGEADRELYKTLIGSAMVRWLDVDDLRRPDVRGLIDEGLLAEGKRCWEGYQSEFEKREALEEVVVELEKNVLALTTSAIFQVADLSRAPYAQLADGHIVNATRHFWNVTGLRRNKVDTTNGLVHALGWGDQGEFLASLSSDQPYKAYVAKPNGAKVSVSTIPFVDDNGVLVATGLSLVPMTGKRTLRRVYAVPSKKLERVLSDTWNDLRERFSQIVPNRLGPSP